MFRSIPCPCVSFVVLWHGEQNDWMGVGVVHPDGDAVNFDGHWHGHQNNEWILPSHLQGLVLMSANEDPVTWLEPLEFGGVAASYMALNWAHTHWWVKCSLWRQFRISWLFTVETRSVWRVGIMGGSVPYIILKRVRPIWYEEFLTLNWAKGRKSLSPSLSQEIIYLRFLLGFYLSFLPTLRSGVYKHNEFSNRSQVQWLFPGLPVI